MVCYRRRGHSEVDEPSFTQPLMYDTIDSKRSVRKLYTESLIGRGDITLAEAEQALRNYQSHLERVFVETRDASMAPTPEPKMAAREVEQTTRDTAIPPETIKRILETLTNLPDGFTVHPRLLPQLHRRAQMIDDGTIDWGLGEMLAFGAVLLDGRTVRLAGQDSRRGTFGHRHAALIDRHTGAEYVPLRSLGHGRDGVGFFYVYDSLLSEFAALGFEYGYSIARPEALVLWEAQFGDFVNGAQSIIDEFASAGEAKWGQRSGLVMLLPHGYEGQGPDHSSARIERWLQLCAEDNLTVAYPSTPAQYFHLLRRQSATAAAPALRGLHPEIDVAAARVGLGDGGLHRRRLAGGAGRSPGRPRGGDAGAAVRRQDLLRPRGGAEEARDHRRRPPPGRAALPDAHGGRRARPGRVPAPARPRLGAGRAREPGCVAAHGPLLARRLGGARARGRPA